MIARRFTIAAGIVLTACGCAGAPAARPLSPEHPASPQAAEAPAPQRSTTLRAEQAPTSQPATADETHGAHEGHH